MKIFGELEKAQAEQLAADPTGAGLIQGRVWQRTDTKDMKFYDGTVSRRVIDDNGEGAILLGQISTPSNPVAGKHKIYFKADGTMYTLDENGNELPVGSGSGSGGVNYIPDNSSNIESTTGDWLTDDGTSSASGILSLSVTSASGEFLIDSTSLKFSKSAADGTGHFYKLASKTLSMAHRGRVLSGSFEWKPLSGYVAGDLVLEVWDVTNLAALYVVGPEDLELLNYQGKVQFKVYTEPTTGQVELRLKVNNANTNAYTAVGDDFQLSPFNTVVTVTDGPVAEVIALAASAEPEGNWLYCDGSAVSRVDYSELFAAIGTTHGSGDGSTTFNLPDYRGRFLRGQADGSTLDPDRASRTAMNTGGATGDNVGSVQSDQFGSHNHGGGVHSHTRLTVPSGSSGGSGRFWGTGGLNNGSFADSVDASGTIITTQGGNETRPENAYVKYWIRYRSASNVFSTTEANLSTVKVQASMEVSPAATIGKAVFTTVNIDNLNIADTATDSITIPKTGTYSLSLIGNTDSIAWNSAGDNFNLTYRVNGGAWQIVAADRASVAHTGRLDASGSTILSLQKNDVLEFGQNSSDSTTSSIKVALHELPDFSTFSVWGETEFFEVNSSTFTAFAVSAWTDITSFSLSKGEWDISVHVVYKNNGVGVLTNSFIALSEFSGTTTTDHVTGKNVSSLLISADNGGEYSLTIPRFRVIPSSDTTYYLKGLHNNGTNKQVVYHVTARRIK